MHFADSATLQFRTIMMLVLQRFRTRHGTSRAGYAWAVIEPLCWVFVLKFGFHPNSSIPPVGTSFEVFFATGVVLARTWRTATQPIIRALTRVKSGGLPIIKRLDLAYAIWITDMITGAVVMTLILGILAISGNPATPHDLLSCIIVYASLSVFTISFAIFMYLVLFIFPFLRHFLNIILIIMFFTSGFAMVMDRMVPEMRFYFSWNPLFHFVEWFREGFYNGYECKNLDLQYVFATTMMFLFFGLLGERAFRRQATKQAGV